jgi:hypothetical protein
MVARHEMPGRGAPRKPVPEGRFDGSPGRSSTLGVNSRAARLTPSLTGRTLFLDPSQAINCLATFIQSLRDKFRDAVLESRLRGKAPIRPDRAGKLALL